MRQLFVLSILVLDVSGMCPVLLKANHSNECFCGPSDIKCTGLDEVPQFDKNGFKTWSGIYLQRQEIRAVPKAAFWNLKIRKIVLNHNAIGNAISVNAWTGIESTLEELHMCGCRLKNLPDGMLLGMRQLRILHLFNNELQILPASFFQGAPALQELILWGNNITRLGDNTFAGLRNLKKLDLDKNSIVVLEKGMFRHLTSLESLHIGENKINSLSSETFNYLRNLKVLNLDRNGLEFLLSGAFDGLSNLAFLGLQHNKIGYIPDRILKNSKKLTVLRLNYNKIEHLWSQTFDGLTELHTLYLSNNRVTKLPEGIFQRLTQLRHLFLDNNQLTTLKKCIFTKRSKLQSLSVSSNPIQCDCRLTWMVDLHDRGVTIHGNCDTTEVFGNLSAVFLRHNYLQCSLSSSRCRY